ncbi:hypothetical protein CVO_03130 [Sulfurimonas sp. CVO]|jgi:flagellar motor switch protein FliG|uniref:hypothetical protein n=1 Tax=Sulfurimonas sp. CVO TaxID=2283483 RepID=UPI00132EDEB5|nr:hypothetical protein [Sulfurimonas sp. CVO]QHG90891.1 hypothetical protein CVO_03130 [Sulfurimonas sp. CVO]
MRRLYAAGINYNQSGIRDILKNLSTEDKNSIIVRLSSMNQTDRSAVITQIKKIDPDTLSLQDYVNALNSMLNKSNLNKIKIENFSVSI